MTTSKYPQLYKIEINWSYGDVEEVRRTALRIIKGEGSFDVKI